MLTQRAENHDVRAGANHVGNVLRGLFSVLQLECQLHRNEEILGNALVVAVQRVGNEARAPVTQSGSCAMIDGEPFFRVSGESPFFQASRLVLSTSRAPARRLTGRHADARRSRPGTQ